MSFVDEVRKIEAEFPSAPKKHAETVAAIYERVLAENRALVAEAATPDAKLDVVVRMCAHMQAQISHAEQVAAIARAEREERDADTLPVGQPEYGAYTRGED